MLPLGHCDDGLLSRPDASDELKGSGTSACSASVPSPSPLEFLKWTGSATFKGSIRDPFLLVFLSGSFQKGVMMADFVSFSSNSFLFFY